jgi:hypothetical protein
MSEVAHSGAVEVADDVLLSRQYNDQIAEAFGTQTQSSRWVHIVGDWQSLRLTPAPVPRTDPPLMLFLLGLVPPGQDR